MSLVLLASLGAVLCSPLDQLAAQAVRYPVIVVPRAAAPPHVDGVVGEDEWARACLISDLIYDGVNTASRNGLAARCRTQAMFTYDDQALYLAVRCAVPAWFGRPIVKHHQRDITAGGEDNVDIFLNPLGDNPPGERFHISINADSNFMDRDLKLAGDTMRWNPALTCKSRITAEGWEGELKIPFAELDAPTPNVGDVWEANIVGVLQSPESMVVSWSYWQTWRHTARHGPRDGWLVFGGDAPAVRFIRGAGHVATDGLCIEVVDDATATIRTQLFQRPGEYRPADPGVMTLFSNWLDNVAVGGSDTYGMSYEKVEALLMAELKPVGEAVESRRSAVVQHAEQGEYLLAYRATSGDGRLLAAGSVPFRIEPPISIAVQPMMLGAQRCQVNVDVRGLGEDDAVKSVRLQVREDDSVVLEREASVAASRATFELAAGDLPIGTLALRAEAMGVAAAVLGAAESPMPRPAAPEWWTKPEGLEPRVPEPWTPVDVSADGRTVQVWGRTYRFDGLPTPALLHATPMKLSQAENDHQPVTLLDGPIAFRLVSEGQEIAWTNARFEVTSREVDKVVIESENRGGSFLLKARSAVEFDGMIRVDFELSSDPAGKTIDSLQLVLPYREAVAQRMSTYRKAPGPGSHTTRFIGNVPAETWKYSVFYTHFLGNDEVGLEWFCDDMRGWRVNNPDEAAQVRREGERVIEQFNFVDHTTALDEPIAITFGLIATPTKQARVGWETTRFDQNQGLPPTPGHALEPEKSTDADVKLWLERAQHIGLQYSLSFWPHWTGVEWFPYPVAHDAQRLAWLREKVRLANSVGVKFCPHGGWQSISTQIPEWPLWGHEMIAQPAGATLGKSFYACYRSPYTDFWVGNFAANARDVPIHGVRFDTIFPQRECASTYHGCGWTDHKGRAWPSQNLFAAREFFKRCYRVMHGGVHEHGMIYFPLAGPPINAIDSFVDIHEIGEGNFERAHTIKEGYPQDDVRTRMTGSQYGFVTSNNLKGHTLHVNERIAALIVAGADPRFGGVAQPSYYYRGYTRRSMWGGNTVDIWNAWQWIDRGYSSLWMPYWKNQDTLAVAAPADAETYCSYYYVPGKRVLLLFSNYEQRPLADVRVKLDLAKLGFAPGSQLFCEDAINQSVLPVEDGAVTFDVLGQRFRMLKISADLPAYHPSRLGENLFPAGVFETDDAFAITRPIAEQTEPVAARDTQVKRGGAASLRLTRTHRPITHTGEAALPTVELPPGRYLATGYIRLDANLELAIQPGGGERPDYSECKVYLAARDADAVAFDPPRRYSNLAGTFGTIDATAGWWQFMLPFEVKSTTTITPCVQMYGAGRAWLDDLAIHPVKP